MEDNEKQNEDSNNIKKVEKEIKELKNTAEEGAKLAASVASGNVVQAAKSAIKLSKNKLFKKALKRKLMISCAYVMIFVMLVGAIFSVFNTIKDKMIELASNIKTTVVSFWKWFTDDYWIKLDKEVEFETIDKDTRTNHHH